VEANSVISFEKSLYSIIVVLLGHHVSFSPLNQMEKGMKSKKMMV